MSLNLQNILTESILDDLTISKLDKVTLKVFNVIKDDKFYYTGQDKAWDMSDGQRIVKAAEMLKIGDYDYLYSVYDFYNTYSDILFKDVPSEIPKKKVPFTGEYEHILGEKLLQYFHYYYNDKTIYSNETGEFICGVITGDMDEAIMEEMYSVEVYNLTTQTHIFVNMFPTSKQPNKLGWDYLSMDDDLSEFIPGYRGIVDIPYEETIDNGYFDIDFPKDMSDESLKKYFDDIIKVVIKEMIIPNNDLMLDFISSDTN